MKEDTATLGQAGTKKIMASLFSSLPAYLAYLLRLVLTTFIILVGSTWILSWFPNLKNEKK